MSKSKKLNVSLVWEFQIGVSNRGFKSEFQMGGSRHALSDIIVHLPGMSISQTCSISHIVHLISFSAAISACEKGGQWQCALSLLEEMLSFLLFDFSS